jgi:hypothetical protein
MSRTPALIAGTILTGVGLAFNASYGWSLGAGDFLRSVGMAGVFIACVGLKDWMLGQSALAFKARRYGLGAACVIGLLIGAAGSFLAAFGSASEGRDAKADPRAAQIVAYQTAQKVAADTEKRLAVLGEVPNIEEAKARVSRLLSAVEPGIAKRTSGCTVLPTTVGKRVQAVNREACQPVIEAQALVATADEVSGLQAKLDAAREVIAKGAPKAADPLVANVQAFLSTGIDAAAVLSLIVALIVELGAPVCWMIWQMSEPGKPAQAIPGIPDNDAAVPGIVIPRNPFPGNDPPTGGRRGRKPDPRIVNFSEAFREKHGRPPSGSEIKSYFPGIPTSTAYDYAKRA